MATVVHSFRAKDDDKGMTVSELHAILTTLIEGGYGEVVCKERRGDEVIRYVDVYPSAVLIMEAY